MNQTDDMSRYVYPSLDLLHAPEKSDALFNDLQDAAFIQAKLLGLGISASVKKINRAPQATQYALQAAPGTNVNALVNGKKAVAEKLGVPSIRLEFPIPDTSLIGLDVPKEEAVPVSLQELLGKMTYTAEGSVTTIPVGKDLQGQPVFCNIHDLPHALIAGQEGAGQMAFLRQIILSLLYRTTPEQARLLLIDPTAKELTVYKSIPHLVGSVITDARQGVSALWWLTEELSRRYQLFQWEGVRNIDGYNHKKPEQRLPVLVTIVSELGALMDADRKSTEEALQRLAALARATGIYLLLATQRLDVGTITGVVKANVPSRVAFAVKDKNQSRTVIDAAGAEDLIGDGDMLYFPRSEFRPIRVQACSLSEEEIKAVLQDVTLHNAPHAFLLTAEELDKSQERIKQGDLLRTHAAEKVLTDEEYLERAIDIARDAGEISAYTLRRRLQIGASHAGRIIDLMLEMDCLEPTEGSAYFKWVDSAEKNSADVSNWKHAKQTKR